MRTLHREFAKLSNAISLVDQPATTLVSPPGGGHLGELTGNGMAATNEQLDALVDDLLDADWGASGFELGRRTE